MSYKTQNNLPVLQFLAIDTHGPLVALGDADLMAAALHILARVLGRVHSCKHKTTTLTIQECFCFNPIVLLSPAEMLCFHLFFNSSFDKEHLFNRLIAKRKGKQLFYVLHNQVLHIYIIWNDPPSSQIFFTGVCNENHGTCNMHKSGHWFHSQHCWKHGRVAVISRAAIVSSTAVFNGLFWLWENLTALIEHLFLSACHISLPPWQRITGSTHRGFSSPHTNTHSLSFCPLPLLSLATSFYKSSESWVVQCQPLFILMREMEIARCPPPSSACSRHHLKLDVASSQSIPSLAGEASANSQTQTNLRVSGKWWKAREKFKLWNPESALSSCFVVNMVNRRGGCQPDPCKSSN